MSFSFYLLGVRDKGTGAMLSNDPWQCQEFAFKGSLGLGCEMGPLIPVYLSNPHLIF